MTVDGGYGAVPADAEASVEPTKDERTWALMAHLGGPAGVMLSAGLFGFLVPLVIWLARRDDSDFVADQAKEALNFQITLFLLFLGGVIAAIATLGIGLLVVIPVWIALVFLELVNGIIAALRSYEGVRYRYPVSMRLI